MRDIDLEAIDNAFGDGFRFLRFTPAIERQFEMDADDLRCRRMIKLNYLGLLIYHCFLCTDYFAIHDIFSMDLTAHFVVMTPLVITVNLVLARHPPVWLREGVATFAIVAMTLATVVVVQASLSPLRDVVLFAIVLVILFAATMQRLRFWYCVAACLMAQVFYSVGLAAITPFSMDRIIISNFIFVCVLLFSLIGCYSLEHEQRTGYLLRLRDRIRNRQLETMSMQDALTGIGNRRALDAALDFAGQMTVKGLQASIAILLCDIDHFKAFNDANGHQEGDICLRRVALLIAGVLKPEDQAAYRFGGEEFLVLVNRASMKDALALAERIRLAVADAKIPLNATAKKFVTVSVGVACGWLTGEAETAVLIAEADRALYVAKRTGRDRVWPTAAQPVTASPLIERTAV